ncbi:MAG: class C beta-lactamase-related serine hydrolase [Pedobacter sp.]|nr:MAG: class C beta-lactamase-related serine hydrolase [Pedobacter sp.]
MKATRLHIFLYFISFILCFVAIQSCKIGRFVVYNFADIKDHQKFPFHSIKEGAQKYHFPQSKKGLAPKTIEVGGKEIPFDRYLERHKSVAFLIIKNDSIQYEQYFNEYDEASIVPSFSMAKSVTSILIGCAIDDKLIGSVQDPVSKYIPELSKNGFDKVSIEHLLQMTSGLDFNEGYVNPFSEVATFYYGTNLRKAVSGLTLKTTPGTKFEYVSGNPQVLGLVLERALKGKTISAYLQEKIWQPLGMEYSATWSTDKRNDGLEKTFCCLNARARDFAKIGRLYLNNGKWNGKQLVSESWVKQSTKVDTSNGSAWYYQYQWWLPTKNGDYMAQGILGQYVYVNPAKNLVIVRLGSSTDKVKWSDLFVDIAAMY